MGCFWLLITIYIFTILIIIIDSKASCTNTLAPLIRALWRTSDTLTKLYLTHFDNCCKIYISDILTYSTNLQTLLMNALCPLDEIIGEVKCLKKSYNTLVDVELTTSLTTGPSLRPLLQCCPKIRRLCLGNCTSDVMDVDELYNDNLEIFGYNSGYGIPSLAEKDAEFYDGPPGLREIYATDTPDVPDNGLMRLLKKNQKSLQTVHASMSTTKEQPERGEPYTDFKPTYEKCYFERLQNFSYRCSHYSLIETVLLKSIELFAPSLKNFAAANSPNVLLMVDTLIKLPSLEEISLSSIRYLGDRSYLLSSALV